MDYAVEKRSSVRSSCFLVASCCTSRETTDQSLKETNLPIQQTDLQTEILKQLQTRETDLTLIAGDARC
jgi:uncharacterized protein YjaG (DUF416 family)